MFFVRLFFFERTRPAAIMRPPWLIYLSTSNEAGPRKRSDRSPLFSFGQKSLSIPGCVQGAIIELVCLSVYVTFVVFTDCESCTRPISTNPGSMEVDEYGLTRGTCFVASRLEVVAVAGLLWILWCVLDAA